MPKRSRRPCPLPERRRGPLCSSHSVRPSYIDPRRPIREIAKRQTRPPPGPSFLSVRYCPTLTGKCQPSRQSLGKIPTTTGTRHKYGGARAASLRMSATPTRYTEQFNCRRYSWQGAALSPTFWRECASFTTDFADLFAHSELNLAAALYRLSD